MTLVVGLGNPTKKYENNRHNIGFKLIDVLVDEFKATNITKTSLKGALYKSKDTLFLKPFTFMNLSGESVNLVVKYYKIQRVIVIHDDIDLKLGVVKLKHGGGHGGHNGLRSIDQYIGKDYDRVRIGVGKPENKEDVAHYVLSDFAKKESECVAKVINHVAKIVHELILHDINHVANKYITKQGICP